MKDDDEQSPGLRFFRVLLHDFSTKLSIPEAFAEQISNIKRREKATIVSHNGKIWHVDLHIENKVMYISGDGWHNFARANDLQIGHLLVFKYKGNMVFNFRVFDLSTCEKTIRFASKSSLKKKETHDSSVEILQDSNSDGLDEDDKNTTSKKRKKAEGCGKSFEVTYKGYMFPQMRLPGEFINCSGNTKEVNIQNSEGLTWVVGLTRYNGVVKMMRGWRNVARDNDLKEGDKLIFKLESSPRENERILIKMET